MIFVPAAMAFAGVSMWLSAFRETGPLSRNLIASVGGAIVFLIDLGVMTSLSVPAGNRRRAASVAMRVSFALVLGYVIAKPFVVWVYEDEVARLQREKKRTEVFGIADKAHEQREKLAAQHRPMMDQFRTARADIEKRIEALTPQRQVLQQRYLELDRERVTEGARGQDGRPRGKGDSYEIFKEAQDKIAAELKGLADEENTLKTELERLSKEEEASIAKVVNDPKFKETNIAFDRLIQEAKDSGATSLERQNDLIREYVAGGGIGRWIDYLLYHLLFIFADTVPVMIKITMLPSLLRTRSESDDSVSSTEGIAEQEAHIRRQFELRRTRLRASLEDADVTYQAVAHLMLRYVQVETEISDAYHALIRKRRNSRNSDDSGWTSASQPLRDVHKQILDAFTKINGSTDGVGWNGENRSRKNGQNSSNGFGVVKRGGDYPDGDDNHPGVT